MNHSRTDSLDTVQAALRRAETQGATKEARLREEVDDLQNRCREAEQRSQDLSSSVPEATRPLLRQIEALQAGGAERQRVWDQLEQQLRQRCADAEAEARAAVQVAVRCVCVCVCVRARVCVCGCMCLRVSPRA